MTHLLLTALLIHRRGTDIIGYEQKSIKQVNKNILYEKVVGFQRNSGVKSKETRSYQRGKCDSPIFSTFEILRVYVVRVVNIGLLHFSF